MLYNIDEIEQDVNQMGFLAETIAALPIVGDAAGRILNIGKKPKAPPPPKEPGYMPFLIAGGVGLGAILLIMAIKK